MTDDIPQLGTRDPRMDWEALARYAAGESPADEARAVAAWLAERPADAALLAALDGAVARGIAATPTPDVDVEAALRRVRARIDAPVVLPLPTGAERAARRGASARPMRWRVGGLAAAAAIAAIAVGVVRARNAGDRVGTTSARTYATSVGARDSVRLPDGTRVTLAPGSRLVVAAGYGGARRDVQLEGEAFFTVRHDAARPFAVHAGPAVIRDVGTAFAARTDAPDGVSVVVTEGIVEMRGAGASDAGAVRLTAGDRAVLRPDGRVLAVRGGAAAEDVAWTQGRLVYRDAPLAVVRADLRRWYGLELRVADSALASRHLTATFAGDSAARVLEVIGLALGADVERRGDTAVVRARRSTPRP